MLRIAEGVGVLLLFALFFSYLLAPLLPPIRRRLRVGRRRRPISDAAAILIVYAILFVPAAILFRTFQPIVRHWLTVTAPEHVDRLFAGGIIGPLDSRFTRGIAGALERDTRATLEEGIAAAKHALWLIVVPIVAFLLLTFAPAFQRSALRVLPHGHLQWRFEEYARDVNSALAGYVRAQVAAGLIVGSMCAAGFAVIGLSSPIALGVLAGILELLPAIGPLTVLLIATAQREHLAGVVLFLAALRVAQDYFVYPRLIRRGMHLSTVAVIVTVWLGATLAGAAGVLLAIPAAGCLSVSVRHWREYRDIERLIADRLKG
jgi:predicted PurR-regulated permease PerM